MKKIVLFSFILSLIIMGCSSKVVTVTPAGDKQIATVTDASKFSDTQTTVWAAYYAAVANPPVIAKITQPDGTIVDIHSQVPPPTPDIKQHQNQIIQPLERMVSTGVKIIGGGLVLREVVDAMQGVNINNSGSGSITYDQSETVDVATTTIEDSTVKDNSDNPTTVTEDNHIENAEPEVVVVEKEKVTTVNPEVVVIEKESVIPINPEVIIVDPSYPPTTE